VVFQEAARDSFTPKRYKIMSKEPQQAHANLPPPKIDADGQHWEQHGKMLFHAPIHPGGGQALTAACVTVCSRADKRRDGDVLLSVARDPFMASFYLRPDDAEALADNLRAAARRAREVAAIKARRKPAAAA